MTHGQESVAGPAWGSMQVRLAPGELLVARQGHGLVIADPHGEAQEVTTDQLLELCAGADGSPAASGADLVRATAVLLGGADPAAVPALALVAADAGDLLVTLTRGMRVRVSYADGGSEVLSADNSLLPVNRVLGGDVVAVALAVDPERLEVDRRSNLSDGVVRAGGMLLEAGPDPRAVERPSPAETMVDLSPPPITEAPVAPTFTIFPLQDDEPQADTASARSADEPFEPSVQTHLPPEPGEGDVMVRGIVCSRGHFNPPDARFCERCGISTVHQTHNVVTGARPPLGVLVLDDGSVHTLDRDVLIGRAPEEAPDGRTGRCALLTLDDPELSLSRTHARLVLDGWEIRVEDAGSVNGTFLAEPGSDQWAQLEANRPTTIRVGSRLRMGSRVLTYESHHRA